MNLTTRPTALRWGMAGVIFSLYAIGSVWIITVEGEAYRSKFRDKRLLARADPSSTGLTTAVPHAESKPSVERSTITDVQPSAPIEVSRPSIPIISSTAEPKPAVVPEANRPAASAAVEPSKSAPGPPADPFWDLPENKKVWDLDQLTIEDEKRLGADIHRAILHYHKPVTSGPLPGRLADAADRYASKGTSYKITVLDCDESNVFSHPGGYLYACRGLFEWISEEEDYALEFVVAHEIAHLEKFHALNCLRDPELKKSGIGTVPLIYGLLIPWGYREEQDMEADRWAAQRMGQNGRSRHETMAFLRKLEDFARKHEFETIRSKPTDDPRLDPLDNHLKAHPIVRDRLKALKISQDRASKTR